jgi:hypothetical protein
MLAMAAPPKQARGGSARSQTGAGGPKGARQPPQPPPLPPPQLLQHAQGRAGQGRPQTSPAGPIAASPWAPPVAAAAAAMSAMAISCETAPFGSLPSHAQRAAPAENSPISKAQAAKGRARPSSALPNVQAAGQTSEAPQKHSNKGQQAPPAPPAALLQKAQQQQQAGDGPKGGARGHGQNQTPDQQRAAKTQRQAQLEAAWAAEVRLMDAG